MQKAALSSATNPYNTSYKHVTSDEYQKILLSQLTGGGREYTCDSTVGSCTCIGVGDCWRLAVSDQCDPKQTDCHVIHNTCSCICKDPKKCKSGP